MFTGRYPQSNGLVGLAATVTDHDAREVLYRNRPVAAQRRGHADGRESDNHQHQAGEHNANHESEKEFFHARARPTLRNWMTKRNASFTAFSSRKARFTSGSRGTRFVPER